MPVLLCSLGTSWAVVPEAFHLLPPGPQGFSAVHVITSDSSMTDKAAEAVRSYFASRHPGITLSLSRVDGFDDLLRSEDHFKFEEVLFRWILDHAPQPCDRYICLAGGFKTMSAAMQRAAGFFGAADVFHVLAQGRIDSEADVDEAIAGNRIAFVRLGREPGWPQLREVSAVDYPLVSKPENRLRAADFGLRERLESLLEAQRNIATNFAAISELPFPILATRSAVQLNWLRSPMEPRSAMHRAWLENLPKLDLHCHLGGFATHGPELEAIRGNAEKPEAMPPLFASADTTPPEGWPIPSEPCGLERYRKLGDNNGSRLLRDKGCLQAQCRNLYTHFLEQKIIYAEVRCSPANYATHARSPWDVLADIKAAFDDAMRLAVENFENGEPPCLVNLIIIGTRQTQGDFRSGISRHLALAVTAAEHWTDEDQCRVVGVDLAGFEDASTRAHLFREEFLGIHRCGLALTVHAGENDDAEGVWRAAFDLNARRLGHALHLIDSKDLMRSVADRGIAVEMCPYANLQIKGFPLDGRPDERKPYPLLAYLNAGVRVTVNTDNIGISAASITDNLQLAARLCPGLTPLDVLKLQRHAIDAAFVSPAKRMKLLAAFSQRLEHLPDRS